MRIVKTHYLVMLPPAQPTVKGRDAYVYATEAEARAKIAKEHRPGWAPWIRVIESSYECDHDPNVRPHPEHDITQRAWVLRDG